VINPKVVWAEVVYWVVENLKGMSLRVLLCKLVFGAVVYHLWKQRNAIRHGNNVRSE
jgi:hypothetical protein